MTPASRAFFALAAACCAAALAAGTAAPAAAADAPPDPCAGLVDGRARLDCHDRAARAARAAQGASPSPLSGVCTPDGPCVDHRGGVYHVTPSGLRRHPPRG